MHQIAIAWAFYMKRQINWKKLERFLKRAREMFEKLAGKENDQYYFSCISLGNVYREKNDHTKAMAFYKEANTLQQGRVKKIFAFTNENEKELYLQKTLSASAYYLSEQHIKNSQGNQEFAYDLALSNRNRILSSVDL